MAPQLKENILFETEKDQQLYTDKDTEAESEIEHRTLSFSVKGIYNDLKNLDWSKVVWRNVIIFIVLHLYCLYAIYLAVFHAQWKTLAFAYLLSVLSGLGITMGAHRLWAHRSYKANLPLRIFLAFCQTLAFQNHIYEWARDHRTHHKFSETDADPHNARRGFFFSHMGWLMYRKHPLVIENGKKLDLTDLLRDPVVRFQKKIYVPLVLTVCFVMPSVLPWYIWKENFVTALFIAGFLRYLHVLHTTWCVNSLAHYVGAKPFDKNIFPSENSFVALITLGEGWHNYHHVFPWDYRTSELGGWINLNFTTILIDFFYTIGWATELKIVTPDAIDRRIHRTGDGTLRVKDKNN